MDNLIRAIALLALLGGCDVRVGKGDSETKSDPAAAAQASASPAAGKSKEGEMSIKLPGFDMKVALPKGVAGHSNTDGDDLVYPGSSVNGIHIEAGTEESGGRKSGVELQFRSADPVEKVAAWYRDPARKDGFAIARQAHEGGALVIYGTQKDDGDPFKLQLNAVASGGTEARLTLSDKK